ncbi:Epithelial splicing regulatory protein 1 [Schistosoma japonicum]|nr:Epithelial splicing regulatory protein 1 [Schistosoma japonicum]
MCAWEDGAEFQQFIKPSQIIFHDTKETNLSKIKQSHIKLTNDEIYSQEDDDSTTTDITIKSYVNEEECNLKIIEPSDECMKVTSVNSHILREAPLLETALKHFNQWLQDNNLYLFKNLHIDSEYSPPYSNIQLEEIFFQESENETNDKQYDYELCDSKMQTSESTRNLLQNHLNYTTVEESYELDHVDQQFNFTLNEELQNQPGYWPTEHCKILVKIVQKMTLDGMKWTEFETVNREYYPAIISKSDIVSDNVVVRARGLPWQATDLEIFQFFSGINIAKGGISLVLSKIGRRNGEALIQFVDEEQQSLALRKHKHHVGKRYIEVYAATGQDFVSIAFFANTNCPVQFDADGILFVNKRDGRATGDAFVIFETKAIAERALENNKQHIGNRYIELFKSTPAEVNQVMNSILNPTCEEQIHCWNNLTECTTNNSSVFTVNNNVYMPPLNETNNLLYPNYNLKLLSNQSIIPSDITYPPHIFSMWNSNPSFINQGQQSVNTQQQTLSYGLTTNLSQNANLCLQQILPSTNTLNTSMTNILPIDHLNTFNSLDMLNNFIGVMNTTSSPNQLITTDYTRPGQPIGEAMIQFVTELSAQKVCEQKHKSIFIKYGLPFPFGVYVDVIQCTIEDLNQLLSNMSRNIETFTNLISSSTSSVSTVASMNPLTLTQLSGLDELKSIHGVYHDSIPKSSIPLHTGYGITQPNFVQLKNIHLNPFISSRELNNFNIPPPILPNVCDYIPGINNAFPLSIPCIENITNGKLEFIICMFNKYVLYSFHISNNLIGSKHDNKPIIVTINGLPNDMNSIDFNKWLQEKIKHLNILSIQFENSLNEISNGSVKLYLQHYSDAELIVQEFNNTNLNNFRISAQTN